jgi:hypothetical protein
MLMIETACWFFYTNENHQKTRAINHMRIKMKQAFLADETQRKISLMGASKLADKKNHL